MNATQPDSPPPTPPPDARYETLSGLLNAYRTPVTILLFGLIVSLALFFATLVGQSRAKEREFRNHAAARTAEISVSLESLAAELDELSRAMDAGLSADDAIAIFGPNRSGPVVGVGLAGEDNEMVATDRAVGRQVARALAAAEGTPAAQGGTQILQLPGGPQDDIHFALVRPLGGDHNLRAFVVSRFGALIRPIGARAETAWTIARINGHSPAYAFANRRFSADGPPPDMPQVQTVLNSAPFILSWRGQAPFDVIRIDMVPRRSYLLSVGFLPWIVLAFSMFATMAIGALALKDARRAEDIRHEVDRKTAELKYSRDVIAAKNEELARFAAHASHDLQAPLRAMKGISSLLVERRGEFDDRSQDMLRRINRGAERAQRLVQDLLSYTRADAAQVKPEPIEPDAIIREIEELLGPAIEECGGTLEWQIEEPVIADRFLFIRALQNLVANAIKYRSEEPPLIEVSARRHGQSVTICVADNGIGIDRKHFQRIFNVFERLHGNDAYEGSGIGLALCKRVADLHGGRIWVESEPGLGSRFHLYLPAPVHSGQPGPLAVDAAVSNDR
ncbi:ATP-binding protein [Maricaulis sp.]|uniref:sensor histidine kinase n=1 Tax=Maricaulis sp. TaxID=1486257 RepID=UPI002610576C|nr:ATP-binding protein [Maricaulis sp.]